MSDAAPETRFTCTKISEAASLISIDPGDPPAWDDDLTAFLAPDTPDKAIGPMRQVFAVARAHGCTTIVLDHHYLDSDYRS